MAEGIEVRKNSIRVQLNGVRWTVEGKPTKAKQEQVSRQRRQIKLRVNELGEDINDVLAEIYGQKQKVAGSLGYYFQHFIDVVAPEKVVESTLSGYESAYNAHWLPFDHRPIDRIKISELQRELASKDISKKTRRNALSVLRMTYACAVPEVFAHNPISDWTIPKAKDDEEPTPDPYDADEWPKLLSWLREHDDTQKAWRYFSHGFGSGMRTGELLGSDYSSLEKPYQTVKQEMVRRKLVDRTKTTGKNQGRQILLPEFVWDALYSDIEGRFKKGFIHLNTKGEMWRDADWLMAWWNKAHVETDVRKREGLYPWRSTYISIMISAGENEYDVARMSGNSPAIIRRHYMKHRTDKKADNAYKARMDERFAKIIPEISPKGRGKP